MIWTWLSFGIIVVWVAGMVVAAKLADKSDRRSREADSLGNCRRGAIKLSCKMTPPRGATLIPKGPR